MQRHTLIQRIAQAADLTSEPVPGQPLIEIVSDRSVLIENHRGVTQYSTQIITVRVKYGCISVKGCALELSRMTKEQLIITGKIDAVELCRR